jgi:hypothetical protein
VVENVERRTVTERVPGLLGSLKDEEDYDRKVIEEAQTKRSARIA